jgi:threonine dehydrogenase-like Zn-dependent dehydrogenase
MAKHKCDEETARKLARENIFKKTVVFGLGMTGLFIADQIRRNYPDAEILFVGRSDENCKKVQFSKEIASADYLSTANLSEEETAKAIIEKLGGRSTMFVGTSGSNVEHRVAFEHKVLGCNGIYNSFSLGPVVQYDTMPFGFENHLIFASINFRQAHMEKAIEVLVDSRYDEVVELIDKDEFTSDPLDAYENKIFCKGAPLKTGVIWNKKYIEEGK